MGDVKKMEFLEVGNNPKMTASTFRYLINVEYPM